MNYLEIIEFMTFMIVTVPAVVMIMFWLSLVYVTITFKLMNYGKTWTSKITRRHQENNS